MSEQHKAINNLKPEATRLARDVEADIKFFYPPSPKSQPEYQSAWYNQPRGDEGLIDRDIESKEADLPALEYQDGENTITKEDLSQLLREWMIPLDDWNSGKAKSLDHLLNEINEGECTLSVEKDDSGKYALMREGKVAGIDVYYSNPESGERLRLIEKEQVFKDGRTKTRPHVTTSIGEKLKADEDDDIAAIRAVEEELGFTPDTVVSNGEKTIVKLSESYPGLRTKLALQYYVCEVPSESFKAEGYVERQPDKDIYFIWQAEAESADANQK